jgi:hypothetical protein
MYYAFFTKFIWYLSACFLCFIRIDEDLRAQNKNREKKKPHQHGAVQQNRKIYMLVRFPHSGF